MTVSKLSMALAEIYWEHDRSRQTLPEHFRTWSELSETTKELEAARWWWLAAALETKLTVAQGVAS